METKDFVLGYGAGKNSAVSEKIVEEVDAWLDEHITNPDSPPLDRSLTSSSAAAPADMVGDINDEVGDLKNTLSHKADIIYDTASGDIASFPDGADGLPVKNLTVAIEPVQSGTGDPSPTNVRPISGWTGCNVTRTGVNIWDEEWELGTLNTSTGEKVVSSSWIRSKNFVRVEPGKTYSVVKSDLSSSKSIFIVYYAVEDTTTSVGNYSRIQANGDTFTAPYNSNYLLFTINQTTYSNDISINSIPADTSYHASHVQTIPISWQSEAGTVYGGTLDVTSGVLTVDYGIKTLTGAEGITWDVYGSQGVYKDGYLLPGVRQGNAAISGICSMVKSNNGNIDSYYLQKPAAGSSGIEFHYVLDYWGLSERSSSAMNAKLAEWNTAGTPLQIVYKLAQPQTYQLTPAEVITTLLGQNNVWADCGPSTVEYPADTKLYIQKINTPTDDDMIADANIASGKYFIVNNNLYLSTTAILAGDPIKPGTNCTLTNLAAALNAINS